MGDVDASIIGSREMIDVKVLQRTMMVGTVLQIAMVITGHFVPWVRDNVFMFGGMLISGVAGLLYAREVAAGWARGALGGAIAGGLCALIGIGVSVLLGDTPYFVLGLGTGISVVTGTVGGLWGEVGARIRAKFG